MSEKESLLKAFKMPKQVNIAARSSSITNSFVNGIIPYIFPTELEVKKALEILALNAEDLRCAYCGDKSTEWDHLRPIVKNKKPTGYISDIYNLVPACGKCNQSKGNKLWYEWIVSDAVLSPKTRMVEDLAERIERLAKYEKWGNVVPIDFESIVESETWEEHWKNCERLHEDMRKAQELALVIRQKIKDNLKY
ncbi:HNH endonuclease signature motif containing protein [Neobacillus rhizosphaerae]|uniref:HNH endonuclease n=1 Tax=Neobacillus rhizosphaerae TaxID=2880965 RepID=UPI003D26E219